MSVSFDTSPLLYQLLVFVVTVGLGGWLFYVRASPFPEKLFIGITATYLLFLRLPVLVYNRELNADESQMLTQALTLTIDPVYWRSVDGTTGGPLSSYFLIPFALLTGRFDYIAAHCAALFLVLVTVFFLFKALKNWFGPHRAAFGIFPAILFYGFTKNPDFVHYTSEHMPLALLSATVWLLSSKNFVEPRKWQYPLVFGILMTLVPFGKLQAVPAAAGLGVYALWLILYHKAWNTLKWAFWGATATCLVILSALWLTGVLNDFYTYYIKGNFMYKNDTGIWENLQVQFLSTLNVPDMLILAAPPVLFGIFYFFSNQTDRSRTREVFVLGLGLLVITTLAVTRTGSGYIHYLLFMILPLSLISGSLILPQTPLPFTTGIAYSVTPIIAALSAFSLTLNESKTLNHFPSGPKLNRDLPFSETGVEASAYLKAGDFLVVWGWNCQYYVECQAPQGVAENHSIRSTFDHFMREDYRKRYIKDMHRTRPVVFIDAVGKNSLWLHDSLAHSSRSFPELAAYIDRNYVLAGKPDGNRMFVRNDIYKSQQININPPSH